MAFCGAPPSSYPSRARGLDTPMCKTPLAFAALSPKRQGHHPRSRERSIYANGTRMADRGTPAGSAIGKSAQRAEAFAPRAREGIKAPLDQRDFDLFEPWRQQFWGLDFLPNAGEPACRRGSQY